MQIKDSSDVYTGDFDTVYTWICLLIYQPSIAIKQRDLNLLVKCSFEKNNLEKPIQFMKIQYLGIPVSITLEVSLKSYVFL